MAVFFFLKSFYYWLLTHAPGVGIRPSGFGNLARWDFDFDGSLKHITLSQESDSFYSGKATSTCALDAAGQCR